MLIEKNSPLSMALSFEIVKRGQKMSVEESLQMDFRIDQALLNFPDYFEGVNNLLVNKDRSLKPNWVFKSVEDISPEIINYILNYPCQYDLSLPKDVETRLKF